jgi:cytochrome d ubiquinol oxidase subunit I
MHTLATFLVAFGTTLSAFWILVLNSWMHTPAGFEMREGVAHAADWWAIVFNPSMPYRFAHMLLASFLTVAFLLAGISAYRWLRGDRAPAVIAAMRTGVFSAALLVPVQIVVGDLHGLNTLEHQPQKIAAIEAVWQTERGAPLVLFGMPDEEAKTTHAAVKVPKLASLILTHDPDGELKGLNEFEGQHPPVAPVFWSFRIMVGIGMAMLLVGTWGAWRLRRGHEPSPLLAKALTLMSFSGWGAVLAGWYTTEIGRQPWLVQGVLTTADAASAVPAPMIGATLAGYLLLYAALLAAYVSVIFHMARKAAARAETPRAEGPGVVPFTDPALAAVPAGGRNV